MYLSLYIRTVRMNSLKKCRNTIYVTYRYVCTYIIFVWRDLFICIFFLPLSSAYKLWHRTHGHTHVTLLLLYIGLVSFFLSNFHKYMFLLFCVCRNIIIHLDDQTSFWPWQLVSYFNRVKFPTSSIFVKTFHQ